MVTDTMNLNSEDNSYTTMKNESANETYSEFIHDLLTDGVDPAGNELLLVVLGSDHTTDDISSDRLCSVLVLCKRLGFVYH